MKEIDLRELLPEELSGKNLLLKGASITFEQCNRGRTIDMLLEDKKEKKFYVVRSRGISIPTFIHWFRLRKPRSSLLSLSRLSYQEKLLSSITGGGTKKTLITITGESARESIMKAFDAKNRRRFENLSDSYKVIDSKGYSKGTLLGIGLFGSESQEKNMESFREMVESMEKMEKELIDEEEKKEKEKKKYGIGEFYAQFTQEFSERMEVAIEASTLLEAKMEKMERRTERTMASSFKISRALSPYVRTGTLERKTKMEVIKELQKKYGKRNIEKLMRDIEKKHGKNKKEN